MIKLQLKSDFSDFYDYYFDKEGAVFIRNATGGLPRSQMLRYLQELGFLVPPNAKVKNLAAIYPDKKLVVYTDEMAHRGEGKELLSAKDALEKYPEKHASIYIEESNSISHRLLQVGGKRWWLKYESTDDWRSNVGEVKIDIESYKDEYCPLINQPLFAIDFVPSHNDELYWAVDFNVAPGIRYSGLEETIKPTEIVNLIKDAVEKFGKLE